MRISDYNPLQGKKLRILNEQGVVNKKLEPKIKKEDLLKLYETMLLARVADEKAFKLQRSGRMGTFAMLTGQEAQVGVALAMNKEDWLFPSFREHAALVFRGMPLENFYLVFMGNEIGNKMPKDVNNFPISVPVGSQTLHAVGAAWAAKIQNKKMATVAFFGDGGTSEGDFHEAMNFAGVFKTPTVFVCQNNQYAISLPRTQQTASKTIAQKAIAYGFEGIQVDGNDVLAVYVAAKLALDNARQGKGPTLIEMETYRLGPHTTSDDPTIYRMDKEVKEAWKKEPIKRFQLYLKKKKLWNETYEKQAREKVTKIVDAAIAKAESIQADPKDIFNYTYEQLTPELQEQMKELEDHD